MNKKFVILTAVLFCAGCRIGIEPTEWEMKKSGSVLDLKGEKYSQTAVKIGLAKEIGEEKIRFKLGADIRYNPRDYSTEFNEGFHKEGEAIPLDYDPYNTASVFNQVVPGNFSYIPFVGFDLQWSKDFSLGFELGFPYSEWEAHSGYHYSEYDDWQESQKSFWKGFGLKYGANASFKLNDEDTLRFLISAFYETYDPEFFEEKAEIFGSGVFFGLEVKF